MSIREPWQDKKTIGTISICTALGLVAIVSIFYGKQQENNVVVDLQPIAEKSTILDPQDREAAKARTLELFGQAHEELEKAQDGITAQAIHQLKLCAIREAQKMRAENTQKPTDNVLLYANGIVETGKKMEARKSVKKPTNGGELCDGQLDLLFEFVVLKAANTKAVEELGLVMPADNEDAQKYNPAMVGAEIDVFKERLSNFLELYDEWKQQQLTPNLKQSD